MEHLVPTPPSPIQWELYIIANFPSFQATCICTTCAPHALLVTVQSISRFQLIFKSVRGGISRHCWFLFISSQFLEPLLDQLFPPVPHAEGCTQLKSTICNLTFQYAISILIQSKSIFGYNRPRCFYQQKSHVFSFQNFGF